MCPQKNQRYGALVWGHLSIIELGTDLNRYDKNGAAGLAIFDMGYAEISGDPSPLALIHVEQNVGDGILLWPSPSSSNKTTLDLVSIRSNRNGLVVGGGAYVTVRRTSVVSNRESGVLVKSYRSSAASSDLLDRINLDSQLFGGSNTFQGGAGAKNAGAGICLASSANAGTLSAKNNVFGAADCTADAGLITPSNACDGGVDLAITSPGNHIRVDPCTTP